MEQTRRELPDSTLVLVLGILSLIFCWCYGIIGLILGIVAVAISSSRRRAYQANPEEYFEESYKTINAGRICGIIGICISAVIIVCVILFFLGVMAVSLGTLANGI